MIDVVLTGRGAVRAGTVYAIGRNYAAHAREMGAEPDPVVFLKPATSLVPGGGAIAWPKDSRLVHHEVELVLLLGEGGQDLDRAAAERAIAGVAVGVDLTARDLQDEAKQKSWPWARSKGFAGAAPVSAFVPREALRAGWDALDLRLEVDGQVRQQGSSTAMILDAPAVVQRLSRWFRLAPGDVVFTGTPEGVGPIEPGQRVAARCVALGVEVAFTLG